MPKKMEDDELIRLTLQAEEGSNRLNELHGQKAEHESILAELDESRLYRQVDCSRSSLSELAISARCQFSPL
jgi:hypothetical protein